MSQSRWVIAHESARTTVKIGDQFAFPDKPDELWEVVGAAGEIESEFARSGYCPEIRCRQVNAETIDYLSDRNADWTIDMCGDLVAAAVHAKRATADRTGTARSAGEG